MKSPDEENQELNASQGRTDDRCADAGPNSPRSPSTEEMLGALGAIYTPKYGDWVLEVSHILTEPCCPTAIIRPEGDDAARELGLIFRADASAVADAVNLVAAQAYETLILRRPFRSLVPWSNPGDEAGAAKFYAERDAYVAGRATGPVSPHGNSGKDR